MFNYSMKANYIVVFFRNFLVIKGKLTTQNKIAIYTMLSYCQECCLGSLDVEGSPQVSLEAGQSWGGKCPWQDLPLVSSSLPIWSLADPVTSNCVQHMWVSAPLLFGVQCTCPGQRTIRTWAGREEEKRWWAWAISNFGNWCGKGQE